VAFDRAVKFVEGSGRPGPVDRWRALRTQIHKEVCEKGYDPARNTFVQAYGSPQLDASLLLLPQVGFLPSADPRIVGTVEAIERELVIDGLVRRYTPRRTQDGLPGDEGAFLACSFWLADALVLIGRKARARALFERLLTLRNDLGLLAEEYDPHARRFLGNFPQAFSHVALVNTAFNLLDHGPAHRRRSH
jgi:GH15 family glucan-1,4-alpha-glucosidase